MPSLVNEYPLVSVVIPTYSRPLFLKRCINSVLQQSYTDFEIIVVDDNSPESGARRETEKVMQDYLNDRRITYVKHSENRNGSAARNTGWKIAKGKYITFVDDDDEIDKDKLVRQVECLEALDNAWGACYTGYRIVKGKRGNQVSCENRMGDCYVDALMRTMFMGSGSNLFLRKKVVDEIGGYDETFIRNQDIEFLVRVLEKNKIAFVDGIFLTIHQEGERIKRSFEQTDGCARAFLKKYDEKITALDTSDRERVISVISLERCRNAFYKMKFLDGLKILYDNKVKAKYIIRYVEYLTYRTISHKSFGFNGYNLHMSEAIKQSDSCMLKKD